MKAEEERARERRRRILSMRKQKGWNKWRK